MKSRGSQTLSVRLLGQLDIRLGDAPVRPLESARAESLLAYLLLHRDAAQPRQRLAFLLWPDSTESQARTNLRHVLHNLRRALPDADRHLDVTQRTLQWRPDTPLELDVAAFEAALAREDDDAVGALREAAEAYTGDLLEGCYDEWLLEERERLRDRYLEALDRLCARLEQRGDHLEAIRYAERLVRDDPLREEAYRLLMRLYDERGDRARALRAYHACTAVLERELGVEPSPATREAYEALLPAREPEARTAGGVGGPALVGRAAERKRLTRLWRAAETGHAQLVLVTGEPGIGKTRLVEELRSWCAQQGAITASARSYPAEGALAYGPVVTWLRAAPFAARRVRLDRGRLAELARVLPELGVPTPPVLPDGEQRRRLFDALAAAILAPARPLLLVADDAHWADRETLRFVHYLVRSNPDSPLLVATTARREDIDDGHPLQELVSGLGAIERCVEIELGRLSPRETAVLAQELAGSPLEPPAADRLFAGTEGNPLFVVEALRAGWDPDAITPRVQAVIEGRLARLSAPARELAGVAATVGRDFTTEVLTAATEADDAALFRALDELWRRRVVRESGVDAYDFTHDRIREVAYHALTPTQRRRTHLQVARALERLNAGDPGSVAAHYERAGVVDRAVSWYADAADAAQRMHANGEAIRLLNRALRLVGTLRATPERDERELALVTASLAPVGMVEGFASSRLEKLQRRGLALAREPAPPLLRSLALSALSRGDLDQASRFAERLRARAERDQDDVLFVESAYALGVAAFWQGELSAAARHFESAADRYRAEHRMTHLMRYGMDPQVVCLSRLGNTLWFLGRPQAAVRASDAALALADEVGHPASADTVRVFAALLALELRDADAVRAHAAALAERSREREVKVIDATLRSFEGYVDVLDGRPERGIARIQSALEDVRDADHAPGQRAGIARVLAEACVVAGDPRAGLAAADRLLAIGTGSRLWEAEALRLRADCRLALGAGDIGAELERALTVARRLQARSLELRVATSLLRHRGDDEARRALLAALAGLPETGHTADRAEAEAVLARGTLAERPVAHPRFS